MAKVQATFETDNMLSIEDIERLKVVIEDNPHLISALNQPWVFKDAKERISHLYGMINEDQRKLFLSLLSRYQIHNRYETYAHYISEKVRGKIAAGEHVSITTPHVKPPARPKSGEHFAYEIKSQLNGSGVKDSAFSTHSIIPDKINSKSKYILVDDFSGSGKTIITGIDKLVACGVSKVNIYVEVIFAMDVAVIEIEKAGVSFHRQIGSGKCITDYDYASVGIDFDAMGVYESIESLISISQEYRLGFESSEALLSMKRTPNNTLPIFWASRGLQGPWPAPFPR